MKNHTYIFGHRNPDSDSICSSIAYAEFKNKTSELPAVAYRLGDINRETRFILDYFNVDVPELLETVKTQVSDLNIDKIAPVSPTISIKTAWNIMKKNRIKMLPIVDNHDMLSGVTSVSNITTSYMDIWDHSILSKSGTSLENIVDTLNGTVAYDLNSSEGFHGKIIVAAMHPDSVGDLVSDGDIVICGDRWDSQYIVIAKGASLLIITGGHPATPEILEKAAEFNCSVILTPYDTFTASRLITQSIPIEHVMTKKNIVSFKTDDFVDEIKDIMIETRYRSYPVVDNSNRVIGAISRYHLISKNRKSVILVDHNEKLQSVHGLEDAEICEIIDHHRIADIETGIPIYFRNEPLGSTSTIVGSIFFENGIRPSKQVAGVLAAAIISDTLMLKSPTSTRVDEHILKKLASIANIDINSFSKEMFKAGTSLEGKTADEIFYQDFKTFSLNSLKVGVSQISTLYLEGFEPLKDDVITLMNTVAKNENYDLVLLMVTDILNTGSQFIGVGDYKDIIGKAFEISFESHSAYIPGVVSRKKQVIPPITKAIMDLK